jgi:hypothetical protein
LSDDELADVYPYEDWILARSTVGGPADHEVETDLFAGIAAVLRLPAGVEPPTRLVDPSQVSAS